MEERWKDTVFPDNQSKGVFVDGGHHCSSRQPTQTYRDIHTSTTYYYTSIYTMTEKRIRVREPNELRPIACTQGLLNRADGSSRFSQGDTTVLVAVYGPMTPKRSKHEKKEGATLDVVFQPAIGTPTPKEKDYERIIRNIFEAVVLTSKFPRSLIRIVVQILEDKGSVFATAINATCLALMDAGIEMSSLVCAVNCSIEQSDICLDPTSEEVSPSVCLAMRANGEGGKDRRVLASSTRGEISAEQYFRCINVATRASTTILAFYRLKLKQHCAT